VTEPAPEPIIIFGAAVRPDGTASETLIRRVAAAAMFGARLRQPLYLPTGGKGRFGEAESAVMAALLREVGVAPEQIRQEATGTDTLSSVRAVAAMLRAMGHVGPVRVASSGYHLPRCLLLVRLAGFRARPVPPPRPAGGWWQRWYWRLREVPAIPYDALLMLLARRR
jgi:uncharacterized SAM-binding protein YcdF (DUF218 family)